MKKIRKIFWIFFCTYLSVFSLMGVRYSKGERGLGIEFLDCAWPTCMDEKFLKIFGFPEILYSQMPFPDFFFVKDSVKKVGFDGYDASSLPQWASCTVLHFWDLKRKVLWNTLLFPYICCVLIHLFWVFLQNRFTLCPEVEKSIFPCSVKPL